jgi:hypothetical protein
MHGSSLVYDIIHFQRTPESCAPQSYSNWRVEYEVAVREILFYVYLVRDPRRLRRSWLLFLDPLNPNRLEKVSAIFLTKI